MNGGLETLSSTTLALLAELLVYKNNSRMPDIFGECIFPIESLVLMKVQILFAYPCYTFTFN